MLLILKIVYVSLTLQRYEKFLNFPNVFFFKLSRSLSLQRYEKFLEHPNFSFPSINTSMIKKVTGKIDQKKRQPDPAALYIYRYSI